MKRILVTGGAGFIGSNFVHYMLDKYADCQIVVLDKLTYAGNLDNLKDIAGDPRYTFVKGDICDAKSVEEVIARHNIDTIVNFAAETHVDRSLMEAGQFVQTDVFGTYVLLEASRKLGVERFVQISTDEVYGTVTEASKEDAPLRPRSPYSASKAAGEQMVYAYHATYGLPTLITRSSNNIGPYQYPEKVVPLFITNAIDDQPLPVYGDGGAVRDYIYVMDHCEAIDLLLHQGKPGEAYNVCGGNQVNTLQLADAVLRLLEKPEGLVQLVADRLGHDRRYCLDSSKIRSLGWQPGHDFDKALEKTVAWYVQNEWWWRRIKSGEYAEYYRRQYGQRLS